MNFKKGLKVTGSILQSRVLLMLGGLLLLGSLSFAQDRIKAPVKLKIDDGDFEGVSVVIKNNTTGETNSVPGVAKFDLDLKMNCEYVISFSKPGFITKKIAFNTTAPADRVRQGFYPFNFEVNLFRQYDGVNIVVFNQPVGKIAFNRMIDDFDYDTDYTKQIQSALKNAEEEIRKKQQEEAAVAAQKKKDEEKRKTEEEAQAKADLKAKQEADKKAAEDARLQAAEAAKQKRVEEEAQKQQARARIEEEQREKARARMEEEERARLKASEDAEERARLQASQGSETPSNRARSQTGQDTPTRAAQGSGTDEFRPNAGGSAGSDNLNASAARGAGNESMNTSKADPVKKQETGFRKASPVQGNEDSPQAAKTSLTQGFEPKVETYEKLPGVTVEEVTEANRTITRVTVRKDEKETVFSRVVYNWGGVYFFRGNLSISENLFFSGTGLK